jgi:rare lipoprotein A
MRARRTLRAAGATKTGALSLTMASAAVVLGGAAAGALAAQSSAQPASESSSAESSASPLRPAAHVAAARTRLVIRSGQFATPAGSMVVVHGLLKPGERGAEVKLETRADRHWHTLAVGHTRRSGRFGIRYRVQGLGETAISVRFDGSRRARAVSAAAGKIVALAPIIASWYDDEGNTACGFHATYGVANKTLPCGTKVTLAYGRRTVVATVDDRGPYVYGRTFDLNQNTARYLGMWGVGRVFASV